MTKTVTMKALRPALPQVIKDVDQKFDRFIVTNRGKPVAVIMSPDDYEGLLETQAIMADKAGFARVLAGKKDVAEGRTRSLEEIHRSLGKL